MSQVKWKMMVYGWGINFALKKKKMTINYDWKCPRSMAGCAAALVRAALPQYRGKHKTKIVNVIRFVEQWESKQWIDPMEINVAINRLNDCEHVHPRMRRAFRLAANTVPVMAEDSARIVIPYPYSDEARFVNFKNVLAHWGNVGLDDYERNVIVGRWVVKDMERALDRRLGNMVRKAALAAAVVGDYKMAAYLVEKAS